VGNDSKQKEKKCCSCWGVKNNFFATSTCNNFDAFATWIMEEGASERKLGWNGFDFVF
jgi:hypothetical protein